MTVMPSTATGERLTLLFGCKYPAHDTASFIENFEWKSDTKNKTCGVVVAKIKSGSLPKRIRIRGPLSTPGYVSLSLPAAGFRADRAICVSPKAHIDAADMEYDAITAVNGIFILTCTSLLPIVILGIAFFYAGLTQRRSALTMLGLPICLTPLVFVDWFVWGYSLCYASSNNHFIGTMSFVVLRHLRDPVNMIYMTARGGVLAYNHFLFNGLMKCICVALTFPGCIAERGRVVPMLVFLFLWSCIVYNPVTYWYWNDDGWLSAQPHRLPVLDFAGGGPIHIVSGFTVLAYSYILGPRNPKILVNYRNTNTGWVLVGTFLTLFGWNGFVAGCNMVFLESVGYIFINTVLCGSVSGIIWVSIDYYWSAIPLEESNPASGTPQPNLHAEHTSLELGDLPMAPYRSESSAIARPAPLAPMISATGVTINQHSHYPQESNPRRKLSLISFSSGVMTGLVVVTPAGGYISNSFDFWKCIVYGLIGGSITNISTRIKYSVQVDDALDIFAIHGVAGIIGSILTGIFATAAYGRKGGWVESNWKQIGYQILGCVVTAAYVFVVSCVLLYVIDWVPLLHLRIDKDFNKRRRRERDSPSTHDDNAAENHSFECEETEISEGEKMELLGSDTYELNGEFLMDFMEMIKVIQPDENYDDDIISERYRNAQVLEDEGETSSDYKLREGTLRNLHKNTK